MTKGYFLNTLCYNIFIETDGKKDIDTINGIIDILSEVYKMTEEKKTRCKEEKATIKDLKNRLVSCKMEKWGNYSVFIGSSSIIYIDTTGDVIFKELQTGGNK